MRKQGSRGVEKERMRSREVERDKRRHTYTQTKQTNRQRIALASQPPPAPLVCTHVGAGGVVEDTASVRLKRRGHGDGACSHTPCAHQEAE